MQEGSIGVVVMWEVFGGVEVKMNPSKPNEERSKELQIKVENVLMVAAIYSILKGILVGFDWWMIACVIAGFLVNLPRLISICSRSKRKK